MSHFLSSAGLLRRRVWPKAINWEFVTLLVLVVVNHLPALLNNRVIPVHDTLCSFQVFQFTYSQLYYYGELPGWAPYGSYGICSDLPVLECLTPINYLTLAIGWTLSISNVLLLYKLSTCGEQMLYVAGIYLLCRRNLSSPISRVTIGVLAVLAPPCCSFGQVWLNWRLYYLVPLGLYFLTRSVEEKRGALLWITGVIVIASLLGNPCYFAPLYLFTFSIMFVCMVAQIRSSLAWIVSPTVCNVLSSAVLVSVASVYLWHAFNATESIASYTTNGRDANSYKCSLDCFLTHAGEGMAPLRDILLGWRANENNSFYFGLLPLGLLVMAFCRSRSAVFWGLSITALVLLLVTLGGNTARLTYRFPAMPYYRHMCIYALIWTIALICSGFGLDLAIHFCRENKLRKLRDSIHYGHVVAAFMILLIPLDAWLEAGLFRGNVPSSLPHACCNCYFVWARLAIYLVLTLISVAWLRNSDCASSKMARAIALCWLAALLVDVGFYRYLLDRSMHRVSRRQEYTATQLVSLRPLPPCSARTAEPEDDAIKATSACYSSLRGFPWHTRYTFAYNVIGHDPSYPRFMTNILSRRADQLIRVRGGKPPTDLYPNEEFLPKSDLWLQRALGCHSAKLQLCANPICLENADECLEFIRNIPANRTDVVVLQVAKTAGDVLAESQCANLGTIETQQFSTNRVALRVNVTTTMPVWLIYSDSFHHDWICEINGRRAAVIPANYAFKGVRLEPGENNVTFSLRWSTRRSSACFLALFGGIFALCGATLCGALCLKRCRC